MQAGMLAIIILNVYVHNIYLMVEISWAYQLSNMKLKFYTFKESDVRKETRNWGTEKFY